MKCTKLWRQQLEGGPFLLAVSPTAQHVVASSGEDLFCLRTSDGFSIWKKTMGKNFSQVSFSPDGSLLLVVNAGITEIVAETGEEIGGADGGFSTADFARDGDRMFLSMPQPMDVLKATKTGIGSRVRFRPHLLSLVDRAAEGREGHRPVLSDLRESGAIAQDADIVMLLYREEYCDSETSNKNLCEVIVAKNRRGRRTR